MKVKRRPDGHRPTHRTEADQMTIESEKRHSGFLHESTSSADSCMHVFPL
jgi:hypothetical protein